MRSIRYAQSLLNLLRSGQRPSPPPATRSDLSPNPSSTNLAKEPIPVAISKTEHPNSHLTESVGLYAKSEQMLSKQLQGLVLAGVSGRQRHGRMQANSLNVKTSSYDRKLPKNN
jgi:hypothetical protein